MTTGDKILNEIIDENLVHADSQGVCVWAANSAEILEAIVSKYSDVVRKQTDEHPH